MGDKKLTIAVDGKVSPSFSRMMKEMEQASASAAKMNKATAALAGTGTPGSGPLAQGAQAKGILAQQKALESLGVTGSKVAKILNDQVVRAQQALQRSMAANTSAMGPLIKQLEDAEGRISTPGASTEELRIATRRRDVLAGVITRRAGQYAGAYDASSTAPPVPGAVPSGVGGFPGGQGMGMAGGLLMRSAGIPFGGAAMAMGGVAATTAMVAAAVAVALKTFQGIQRGEIGSSAEYGAAGGRAFDIARSHETAAAIGRIRMARDPSLSADIAPGASVGGATRGFSSLWDNKSLLLNVLAGAGTDSRANRELGRALGKSYGAKTIDAMTERAQEIGGAWGEVNRRADWQRDQSGTVLSMRRQYGAGSWGRSAATAAGYSLAPETFQGYMGGLKGYVGAGAAEGYAQRVAQLEAQGMDAGRALGIVGRGAVTRGNALSGTGRLDATARAIIGEGGVGTIGTDSAMWAGRGTALAERLSGGGITAAYGPQSVFQSQQVVAGMGMASKMFGGHDAYQKSYNIAASSAALGAGADPYQRQALSSLMSDPAILSAVLKGEYPPALAAMGISKTAAQAYAKDVDRSTTARWMDSGGDYSAAKHMRAAKGMGGARQYLESIKDPKAREAAFNEMAPLLAQTMEGLTGGTVGGAVSFQRFMAGGASTAVPGARSGGKPGAPSDEDDLLNRRKEELKADVTQMYDFRIAVKDATGDVKKLSDAHKMATEAAKRMQSGDFVTLPK